MGIKGAIADILPCVIELVLVAPRGAKQRCETGIVALCRPTIIVEFSRELPSFAWTPTEMVGLPLPPFETRGTLELLCV